MRPPSSRTVAPTAVLLTAGLALAACAGAEPAGPTAATSSSSQASTRSAPPPDDGAPPTGTPEEVAAAVLDGLDLQERVAELFLVGVPLDDLGRAEDLVASGIGGVFLAGRSEIPARDLAARTGRWQAAAPGPGLWIAVDQEGGAVQTLSGPGFGALPPAVEQGRLPDDELAALADDLGADLGSAGINLNLAPVADVVPAGSEQDNRPIGYYGRHYASTVEEMRADVATVVDGLAGHGVTAVLKHFPGLGRVRENTDTAGEVVDPVTRPDDPQVRAFAELADSPARPFVMTSSAVYPAIDPTQPAGWSAEVVDGLLRGELGFDGVVVSDDVGAAAAVQEVPPGARAVRVLEAGSTLVLTVDPALLPEMREAVVERATTDAAFAERVDDAARTALLAKAHAGLLTG